MQTSPAKKKTRPPRHTVTVQLWFSHSAYNKLYTQLENKSCDEIPDLSSGNSEIFIIKTSTALLQNSNTFSNMSLP